MIYNCTDEQLLFLQTLKDWLESTYQNVSLDSIGYGIEVKGSTHQWMSLSDISNNIRSTLHSKEYTSKQRHIFNSMRDRYIEKN